MGLRVYAEEKNIDIFEALASKTRLKILQLLSEKSMNISDISKCVDLSAAIITRHITILENCGLVTSEFQSAKHGRQRICYLAAENVLVLISNISKLKTQEFEFLIGNYKDAIDIQAPCGLENEDGLLGVEDDKRYFMMRERNSAEHIWYTNGVIKYKVNDMLNGTRLKSVEIETNISVTTFSENCKKGKILFGICGYKIAENVFTAFDEPMKILLRLDETGTFINGKQISTGTINEITVNPSDFTFEIGAEYYHGIKTILNLYAGKDNGGIKVKIEII